MVEEEPSTSVKKSTKATVATAEATTIKTGGQTKQAREREDSFGGFSRTTIGGVDYGTQVVYALVLEHLKRASNLCVANAETER